MVKKKALRKVPQYKYATWTNTNEKKNKIVAGYKKRGYITKTKNSGSKRDPIWKIYIKKR